MYIIRFQAHKYKYIWFMNSMKHVWIEYMTIYWNSTSFKCSKELQSIVLLQIRTKLNETKLHLSILITFNYLHAKCFPPPTPRMKTWKWVKCKWMRGCCLIFNKVSFICWLIQRIGQGGSHSMRWGQMWLIVESLLM